MNKNTIAILTFLVVLVVYLSFLSVEKIEIIGDFFEKVLNPISIPLSVIIGVSLGILKYKQVKNKD